MDTNNISAENEALPKNKSVKKRYFIIPIVCVTVLMAVIITVALVMDSHFFERASYEHMDTNAYNGVEIIGEDGLFYLSRNGKKVSDGYVYLKSVNDLYGDVKALASSNKAVTLFDYYIAKSASDTAACMLITSNGDKYTISDEGYMLDTQASKLPYLVYRNNKNGLVGAVSLNRLDSDISYKTGSELTLTSFSDITIGYSSPDEPLASYIVAEALADSEGTVKTFYGKNDGTMLTSGTNVELLTLKKKNQDGNYLYFHNVGEKSLVSLSGDLLASGIDSITAVNTDWQYARCTGEAGEYIVVFSPYRSFTLTGASYDISSVWTTYGSALVLDAADGSGTDIINIATEAATRYGSIEWVNGVIRANNGDGQYYYLDNNASVLMQSPSAVMTLNAALSSDSCYVLYEPENPNRLYFTRSGAELFEYEPAVGETVSRLAADLNYDTYTVSRLEGTEMKYALLAPFSTLKSTDYYDNIECNRLGVVSWLKATSMERSELDIIDTLTLKVMTGVHTTPEEFDEYSVSSIAERTLYTDTRDNGTDVHINIIAIAKSGEDLLKNNVRYFALYRSAYYSDFDKFTTAALQFKELGSALLLDSPIKVFNKCLVTYSAGGSEVYSLDENLELVSSASIPYPIYSVIEDSVTEENYFKVLSSYDGSALYGVYTLKGECLLSPYYSSVLEAADSSFVVTLHDTYGVITATAGADTKTLIDFEYPHVLCLCDGAFVATINDNEVDIIFDKRVVLSGKITSLDRISYYTAAEDGSLSRTEGAIVYINGKAYIHR